jgi:predicted AAA+ superfamily ATPase
VIFKRTLEKDLAIWKNNPNRKPLILRGDRQVGKTTLVKEFAKSYRYHIFLNLEKSSDAAFFENNYEAKTIVESLFLSGNISIGSR